MGRLDSSFHEEQKTTPRWQKIMSYPENAAFWDMSTGKVYRRGMLRPIHKDNFENIVDEFQILGTQETVFVPFLRLNGDFKACSLMSK